jgi:hypothetical protein
MTTITIDRKLLEEIVELFDDAISTRYPHEILRDIRSALAAPATAPEPVATVAEVHMSRYTLEWTNGPLPEGTKLYAAPQAQPERKPMHEGEIQAAWLGQDLDEPIPYSFVLGIRSAERFNGIKETP